MAYKTNFAIKMLAFIIMDMIGPLVALLIYKNTAGIPGWTFEEFILFTGTLTLVFGFGHAAVIMMPARIIDDVRQGHFDKHLLRPFKSLTYFLFSSPDIDGVAEITVGLILVSWAFVKLGLTVFSWNFLIYIFLIIIGFIFQYAVMIMISALAFLFVKSWALFDVFFTLTNFARYPLTVYGGGITFFLTFMFPIAISASYPADALLNGISGFGILKIVLPVFLFLFVSVWFWNMAMKKYSSAGG
ncbi:MAG: ABC-2 family transporter protein [Nanoarchaeota archaeon]|nr:ABC-2 family transporter protein [Nanoarchaeota archaeon]